MPSKIEDDLVVAMPLDGLHIGCDCGCFSRVVFHRVWDDDSQWTMLIEEPYYPVRWGPFRRTQSVGVEMVLDDPKTVDALITALTLIRQTFKEDTHA